MTYIITPYLSPLGLESGWIRRTARQGLYCIIRRTLSGRPYGPLRRPPRLGVNLPGEERYAICWGQIMAETRALAPGYPSASLRFSAGAKRTLDCTSRICRFPYP